MDFISIRDISLLTTDARGVVWIIILPLWSCDKGIREATKSHPKGDTDIELSVN